MVFPSRTRGESTSTSEQAGVNFRALRCGTERIMDNEEIQNIVTDDREVIYIFQEAQISRAPRPAPGSWSRKVCQRAKARTGTLYAPEGEAPSRHRRGARVRGSEAQPLTALSVWLSSVVSPFNAGKQSFVISRFRFVRVPFGAPFVPNRSGTRNPKTPPEDGAPLKLAPRFPKRDVLSVSPSCARKRRGQN
jgi:hypothetical protein